MVAGALRREQRTVVGEKRRLSLTIFLPQAATTAPRMSTSTTQKGPVYPVVSLAGVLATR